MTATLVLLPWSAPRPHWWVLAWRVSDTVYCIRPFHRVFFGLPRLAHELGHGSPDEGHHPWTHFCLRSPLALRLRWTHSRITRREAEDFRGSA